MIKIRAFRAVEDLESCEAYLRGHMQVLIDYNVIKVTSYNKSWMSNPSAYVVVAEDEETGQMVGGIRVEVAKGLYPLPIETAIGSMDPHIYDIVEEYAINGGVGELCGLWNSKEVKGVGISFFLTRSAIAIVNQLRFKTMVGICAEYTLKMFTDVGFEIDRSVGKNGEFPYPDERYITRSLGILDASSLATADPYDRERILGLRRNPMQVREETGTRGPVMIKYDLKIKNIDSIEYHKLNEAI
jgi:hypothetical protein